MNDYGPIFISLHWFSAMLIIMELAFGSIMAPNIHIVAGVFIAVLTIWRIMIKSSLSSSNPAKKSLNERDGYLNYLARMVHYGIYTLVFTLILSGVGLAVESNLFSFENNVIESGGNSELFFYQIHKLITNILTFTIILHVAAVFFHQLILKDRLLSKMWFR